MPFDRPSVFTPFFRRFTDERALVLEETRALYREVKRLHEGSIYSKKNGPIELGLPIYENAMERLEGGVLNFLALTLSEITELETTIFRLPEGRLDIGSLSLKEQVDLRRFLRSKQYFHEHEAQVVSLWREGVDKIFTILTYGIHPCGDASPFSVPLITALSDPRLLVDRIYEVVANDQSVNYGIFVELRETMYANLCRVSNQVPHTEHKRPLKHAMDDDTMPLAEIVETYLAGTPFINFLMQPVPIPVTFEQRFSHTHIVGGSGAGKTQLLQSLILHDLRSEDPPALVVVDSQGDLINNISHLALFDPDTGPLADRLVMISPKDIKHPPALNIFDVNRERLDNYDEATKEQVTAGVIQTFDYLFTGLIGADLTAKQGTLFRYIARLMLALPETMGRNATILDIIHLMEDPTPYIDAINSLPPIPRDFFVKDFIGLPKGRNAFHQTKEQVRYRLQAIIENPTIARLFTSEATRIDLFTGLNNGAIILVDTAKDFLKGASANFGKIFISLVYQAILERAAIPEHERKPAFLIVDEAASYFDSNIDDLLTEARKYKLGFVAAHQFLDQCSNSLRASLAANTSIKMASGVSTSDARFMAPEMRTKADFILGQPPLHFACHIRNVTPEAVSIPVQPGRMESQPRLSEDAYLKLRTLNRSRVTLPSPPKLLPVTRQVQDAPTRNPLSSSRGEDTESEW